jgi:hypothetical protein
MMLGDRSHRVQISSDLVNDFGSCGGLIREVLQATMNVLHNSKRLLVIKSIK